MLAAVGVVLITPLLVGTPASQSAFGASIPVEQTSSSSYWRPYLDRLRWTSADSMRQADQAKLAWTAEDRPSKNDTEAMRKLMWHEWDKCMPSA